MSGNFFFLIAVMLNTVLAFYTATFVVESVLILFKIKRFRMRAHLRLFPFCFLIFDRVFTDFNLINWLNPLSCNSCTQKFLMSFFFPNFKTFLDTQEISLLSYLIQGHPPTLSQWVFIGFCIYTGCSFAYKIFQILSQRRSLRQLQQKATESFQPIYNPSILQSLSKYKIKVLVSDQIHVPIATYDRIIILPASGMEEMTQEEFESIVAHELEHIRCRDPFSRIFFELISALYWWIPSNWWKKKIMEEQELACDQGAIARGLNSESLASSLIKITKHVQTMHARLTCTFANQKHPSVVRIKEMLGLSKPSMNIISLGIIGITLEIILLVSCFFSSL